MTFQIPGSLQEYYGSQAIRNAVDALVDALDGTDMPGASWEEAWNYGQALLMAAQVRADLADLLFRVWNATFGQTNPARLGEEYFGSAEASPAAIWGERYVGRFYYRNGLPAEENGPCDGLFAWLVPPTRRKFVLSVDRYSEGENMAEFPADAVDGLEGWHVAVGMDGDYNYLINEAVDIGEFLDDPCPALERFRRDAVEMVDFLAQD